MEATLRLPRSFDSQPHNRARGRLGEDAATAWLERAGYRILARNVETPVGEIDIVARDGEWLCFVEVKARRSGQFGGAVAAVGPRKRRRLVRAAAMYLAEAKVGEQPVRFDVLGLQKDESEWRFHLVRDAFEAESLFLV